jgi:hypothetical protein
VQGENKEEEGERPGRERDGGIVASREVSRGSPHRQEAGGGKQEVASWSSGASTQLLCVPTKKTSPKCK